MRRSWSTQYTGAYGNNDPREYSRITPPDVGLTRAAVPRLLLPPVTQPQKVQESREPSTVETLLLELVNLQRAQAGAAPVALPPLQVGQPQRIQVEDDQRYGFVTHQTYVIDGENDGQADKIVLVKPATQRVYLLIQNNCTVATVILAFGGVATAANGITLTAGGNIEMSGFVAQDDVHIFCVTGQAGAPGTPANVLISYCNK